MREMGASPGGKQRNYEFSIVPKAYCRVKRNKIVRLKMRNARRGEWMETNRETKWAAEFLPWSRLVSKEGIKGSGGSKWDLEGRSSAGEGQTKLLGGGAGLKSEVNEVKRCDSIAKKVGVIAELAWRWQRVALPPPSSSEGVLHKCGQ